MYGKLIFAIIFSVYVVAGVVAAAFLFFNQIYFMAAVITVATLFVIFTTICLWDQICKLLRIRAPSKKL